MLHGSSDVLKIRINLVQLVLLEGSRVKGRGVTAFNTVSLKLQNDIEIKDIRLKFNEKTIYHVFGHTKIVEQPKKVLNRLKGIILASKKQRKKEYLSGSFHKLTAARHR